MAKLIDMSLDELYARKITPSALKIIQQKTDFSQIDERYCKSSCITRGENCKAVKLRKDQVDVVIVSDFYPTAEKYMNGDRVYQNHQKVLKYLESKWLKGLSVGYVDAFKCRIDRHTNHLGKPPTATVRSVCSPYLTAEIRAMNPRVIISLTTDGTKAIGLSKMSSTNQRGEIHNMPGTSIPVVITLHPRITMMIRQNASGKDWGPDFLQLIERDYEKASKIARGDLKVPSLEQGLAAVAPQIHIARSIEDAKSFMEILREEGVGKAISYDLETTSLDPWIDSAKIITAQFGVRRADGIVHAYVFPMWHRNNGWYKADDIWPDIASFLTDPEYKKIGHNIKFDILYTWATMGVRVQGVLFDTMLVLHNLNSGVQGNYGLKRAVWDFMPESGLGGYEDKLPKLTKKRAVTEMGDEDDSESE